jgi:adenylylsulfate kinase
LHKQSGIHFVEVYVDCSLEVAESRDPKGLYKKARGGKIKNLTGIDDPYEPSKNPEIHLKTDQMILEQEINAVILYLEQQGIIN